MRFIKIVYLCFPILFTLIFTSCVDFPDKVIFPQWDVEFNIPLTDKVYTLKDIIRIQKHINIDTTDNIFLLQSGKYSTKTSLSEFVKINESSTLKNIPVITSPEDSFIVYVQFPEGLEVDNGEFATGIIQLSINNTSFEDVSVFLNLPAFYDLQGNSLTLQTSAAPGDINSIAHNIDGYKYDKPADHPAELNNSFRLVLRANSQYRGNIVYTDLSLSELAFNYVTGVVPAKSLGNKTSSYDFDVFEVEEYKDKTFLRDAKLNLYAEYVSMFNVINILDVKNLNIIAKRNDGSEFYLKDLSGNHDFTIRLTDGNHYTVFTEENSNIADFVSFIPDSVILRAEYFLNPENNTGTFSIADSIIFKTDFSIKSYLALRATSIEDQTQIIISEAERIEIKNGKDADIQFDIENGIPLALWLKFDLYDENHNYLFTITENSFEGDSIFFSPAAVNADGEAADNNINQAIRITLNEKEIELFASAHYLNYRVTFSTPFSGSGSPQIIAVRPSNMIKMKSFGKINYRISFND